MLAAFFFAVFFTLGVSALCSVLEAMLLSTRSIEVDQLRRKSPRAAQLLEILRADLEGTIASILTINTVANTLGSITVGALATQIFGSWWLGIISALMTLGILFFSEILPKNIGVLYRPMLLPVMVYPLYGIYCLAGPFSKISTWIIRKILRRPPENDTEGELEMVAEQEAREGRISAAQLHLIRSSLELQDATVEDLMTPRNVVLTCESTTKAGDFYARLKKIPFGRIPITGENPDDILGVMRRKDLLQALLAGEDQVEVRSLMKAPVIVPEIGKLSSALELMLTEHQQLAVVVDEFGGFAGVLALEDIFEFLIGREFYESDDVAVDMQEFARRRSRQARGRIQRGE